MFPPILKGVTVLDFSRLLPGPFASELLIEMGATVKCVVPPVGDPVLGDYSPFEKLRRGKTFECIDLKSESGLAKVKACLAETDILLEGFRPGTMGRLGLGFDQVKVLSPELLYVSINGYSEGHEKYQLGAHDLNFLIDAGVYSLLFPDDSDTIPLIQIADVIGGFYAAFQILIAWIQRIKDAGARHLSVSIVESLEKMSSYLQDPSTLSIESMLTGGMGRYHIYKTKDDKRIMVAAIEPKFFTNLMKVLDLPYQADEDGAAVLAAIREKFSEKKLSEWRQILSNVDACISFIPSRSEVINS